jgi:peptidoglycan/xylan/chitin deacetylase (PgdA/CDA1 family)
VHLKRMIRNTLGWFLAVILIVSGRVGRARRESFRDGVILPVYFHNPGKHLFRKIIFWLKKNGYTFISCDQLLDIMNKRIPCPRGAVWLTFDDGWRGNIENILPLAQEQNIPITIFIYTSAVETGVFWWQKARKCAGTLPPEYRDINAVLKMPEDTRKQVLQLLDRMETPGSLKEDAMTIEDVRRIAAMPRVTIASHTVTHPVFQNCTDAQIDYELGESKKTLEGWTGRPVRAFAYPRGSFTGSEKPLLKKHGYELAVTIESRFASTNDDRYLLPRTDVMNDGSFAENLCHALGVWEPVINSIKRLLRSGSR